MSKRRKHNEANVSSRHWSQFLILTGCMLIFAAGCQSTSETEPLLTERIDKLSQEKTLLQRQVEQLTTENTRLEKRVETLSAIPKDQLELWSLQRIEIGRFTGLYDKDKDGKKEQLVVYVQPIDRDGDTVKSPGSVDAQLWDLNKSGAEAMLGQWQVEPKELKKRWLKALLSTNYRLTFAVADQVSQAKDPLTVKVTFTDLLTGKVFQEQKVIEP